MDIAQLGIMVDSRPVTKGEQDLNRFAVAGERAEKQVVKSAANMNRGVTTTAKGVRGLAAAASNTQNLRNLAFQLNQIGQQGAVTGDFLGAFAIQVPDILASLGSLSLVLAGGAFALGASFLPALLSASGSTKQFEKDLEELEKRLIGYQEIADLASLSTAEFAERFETSSLGIRATIELLERIERSEAQRAIDGITQSISELMQIRGDGDRRLGVADFFDISRTSLFFGQARDELRAMTSEFLKQQEILRGSAGNLDQQIEAMQALISAAQRLAEARGDITAEEEQLLKMLTENLLTLQQQRAATQEVDRATNEAANTLARQHRLYAETRLEADKLAAKVMEAYQAGEDLSKVDVGAGVEAAAVAAAVLAEQLGISLANAQTMVQLGGGLAAPGGPDQARAGVQNQFFGQSGLRRDDIVSQRIFATQTRRRGGGRSLADQFEVDLERLQQQLMTEREITDQWYLEGQEILADRRAQELLTQEEHNAAKLALEFEYSQRVAQLQEDQAQHVRSAQQNATSAAVGFLDTLAQHSKGAAIALLAVNTGLRISEAIQNTAVAATRALAELGPILGPPAAAKIKAFGAAQVGLIGANAALRLASGGGAGLNGGGGPLSFSGPVSPTPSAEQDGSPLDLRIQLAGVQPGDMIPVSDIPRLFEEIMKESGRRGFRSIQFV